MTRRKPNLLQQIMLEKIDYGGTVATRAEVYQDAIDCGCTTKWADRFAFLPPEISDEEASRRIPLAEAREMERANELRIAMEDRGSGI